MRPGEIEIGRTLDLLAFGCDEILLVDGGLAADQGVLLESVGGVVAARGRDVSPCQRALFAVFVIKGEHFSQMQVIPRVTPAEEGVAVPEDAVVPGGDYERDGNLGVVLVKLFVLALVVPFVGLVLSETVKRLVIRRIECLSYRPFLVPVDFDGLELPGNLLCYRRAVSGSVADAAVGLPDRNLQCLSEDLDVFVRFVESVSGAVFLRHNHQGILVWEPSSRRDSLDVDNVVSDNLHPDECPVSGADKHPVAGPPCTGCAGGQHEGCGYQ